MLGGHGNHMIDGDTGHDPRSPMYKGEPSPIISCVEVKFWDGDSSSWELDTKHTLEDVAVNSDELEHFIAEMHGDNFDRNNITAIKNAADRVIINYWIQDNEVEKYEMYYE